MNTPHRLPAALILAASFVALAACSDDEPVAAPPPADETGATGDDTGATSEDQGPVATLPGSGPSATVAPDLPDELVGEVGPVEVIGDALPVLTTDLGDPPSADVAYGAAAPVLVGQDFDGRTVRVNAVSAGPTMVVFLAHWCPHCNAEIPRLLELRDQGRFPEGLNVVGVSTAQTPGQPNFPPSQWIDSTGWDFPTIADGIDLEREVMIAADAYGVNGFPFVALVGDDGTVRARWSGERNPDEIVELIETELF